MLSTDWLAVPCFAGYALVGDLSASMAVRCTFHGRARIRRRVVVPATLAAEPGKTRYEIDTV
jgi:hypothetical protein